jgi:uncharacterized protein YqgV (UPF0045/DUF77 family)
MTYRYLVDFKFDSATKDADTFDTFLDRVIEELDKIGVEADVTASLTAYEASFSLVTDGLSMDQVFQAMSDLRTALHAAQSVTAGWPSPAEIMLVGTRCGTPTVVAA